MLCRVTLGKSFLQISAMKMAHAPPGHHSVAGRPSTGGLNFPEYVVYRGEQAYPEYFITYQIVKPEDLANGTESEVRWFNLHRWSVAHRHPSYKDYLCFIFCDAFNFLVPTKKKCSCQESTGWGDWNVSVNEQGLQIEESRWISQDCWTCLTSDFR